MAAIRGGLCCTRLHRVIFFGVGGESVISQCVAIHDKSRRAAFASRGMRFSIQPKFPRQMLLTLVQLSEDVVVVRVWLSYL